MPEVLVIPVTTTGGAGVSTGFEVRGVNWGHLVGLSIDFDGGAPNTTDITVSCIFPGAAGGEKTLYTKDNSEVDVPFISVTEALKTSGGVDLADTTKSPNVQLPLVGGMIKVLVAQTDDAAPAATVTLIIEPV